jgi:ribosomal protein S18 acetylase RimI-like enzyme
MPEGYELHISERVDEDWIETLFRLKGGVSAVHRRIVPNMYAAIPKRQVAVLVRDGGNVCGTGLGILDRAFVGVYAIQVAPEYRRRGLATRIVETILREGRRNGASGAYLQVVSDNAAAKAVYRRLGFREYYRYYFRVK